MTIPTTKHTLHLCPAAGIAELSTASVDLVVTSPPYPMIEMWDSSFGKQDAAVAEALDRGAAEQACAGMHTQLDRVWGDVHRVLRPGGIVCINIGDAARTIGGSFRLFPNHARIVEACVGLGLHNLPNIIWRKATNAPNKFMGSGMLPPGAYVTLEHEHILIFRKGAKRAFPSAEEERRRAESAYFWEERNRWFSDVWMDLTGAQQKMTAAARARSGAYPMELAWRLVNMFSVKGDTVLDPFAGTGTTLLAAAVSERDSIGYEIEASLGLEVRRQLESAPALARQVVKERIERHLAFVKQRQEEGKMLNFKVKHHGFPCVSRQETGMVLRVVDGVERAAEPGSSGLTCWTVSYREIREGEQMELSME